MSKDGVSFLGGRVVMGENPCIVEVGQATGPVEGRLGERGPAGREVGRADGR